MGAWEHGLQVRESRLSVVVRKQRPMEPQTLASETRVLALGPLLPQKMLLESRGAGRAVPS